MVMSVSGGVVIDDVPHPSEVQFQGAHSRKSNSLLAGREPFADFHFVEAAELLNAVAGKPPGRGRRLHPPGR
jgi:hypothetical protein